VLDNATSCSAGDYAAYLLEKTIAKPYIKDKVFSKDIKKMI